MNKDDYNWHIHSSFPVVHITQNYNIKKTYLLYQFNNRKTSVFNRFWTSVYFFHLSVSSLCVHVYWQILKKIIHPWKQIKKWQLI